jgi:hypothetical protein
MAIQTRDQIISALGNNNSPFRIDKASIANAVAGLLYSLWRATGTPGQGAIPTAAALCDNTLLGGIGFTQQTSPATSYLAALSLTGAQSAIAVEFYDRLAHMGGLNATLTTAQTVTLDLSTLAPSSERLGASNYSDVQWFMEWYADTGATASNATINVTYDDASTGNLGVIAVGSTRRASLAIPLTSAVAGRSIRAINNVTLSASTGAAGNFGFTAARYISAADLPVANKTEKFDWANLGFGKVPNGACVMMAMQCSTTSTGALRGNGKIIHG